MDIVSVKNLSYRYPTQLEEAFALNNVSFSISEGECVTILGPTGAGKSTLCMALNGIVPKVFGGKMTGEIIVAGLNTREANVPDLAQRVGLMFQDPESQFVGLTVEDELFFGAGNYGLPREEILERIRWALQVVRLKGYERREPSTMSGGEKQRVALAAILSMKPRVLALDEPTSELDPLGRAEVFDSLKNLKEQEGLTILVATHHCEELPGLVDRAIVLNEGQVLLDGRLEDVFQEMDILTSIGIHPPQVVEFWKGVEIRLGASLGAAPLTLETACRDFRELVNQGRVQIADGRSEAAEFASGVDANPASQANAVRVRDLWFRYPGGLPVLKGIDLDIPAGDYVAIIGQNGSGKTTLVKHFNGLLKPTQGSVQIFGKDTRTVGTTALSQRVGYAFQNPDHQIFRPSVWEEVAFGPKNLGFDKERLDQAVSSALQMVGLEAEKDTYPFNLGKGQRQKLALASVIAMQSEVLIIDEPTTGLDTRTSLEVLRLLHELNRQGHTIIVITHDIDLVAENVPRTIALSQGVLLLEGPTAVVLSQADLLKETYVTPPQIMRFGQALADIGFPCQVATVQEAIGIVERPGTR